MYLWLHTKIYVSYMSSSILVKIYRMHLYYLLSPMSQQSSNIRVNFICSRTLSLRRFICFTFLYLDNEDDGSSLHDENVAIVIKSCFLFTLIYCPSMSMLLCPFFYWSAILVARVDSWLFTTCFISIGQMYVEDVAKGFSIEWFYKIGVLMFISHLLYLN